MIFTVGGEEHDITHEKVVESMVDVANDPIQKYVVEVEGQIFPPKQVFARVTGRSRTSFTTMEACRVLQRLGFICRTATREEMRGLTRIQSLPPISRGKSALMSRGEAMADAGDLRIQVDALRQTVAVLEAAVAGLHNRVKHLEGDGGYDEGPGGDVSVDSPTEAKLLAKLRGQAESAEAASTALQDRILAKSARVVAATEAAQVKAERRKMRSLEAQAERARVLAERRLEEVQQKERAVRHDQLGQHDPAQEHEEHVRAQRIAERARQLNKLVGVGEQVQSPQHDQLHQHEERLRAEQLLAERASQAEKVLDRGRPDEAGQHRALEEELRARLVAERGRQVDSVQQALNRERQVDVTLPTDELHEEELPEGYLSEMEPQVNVAPDDGNPLERRTTF